MHVSFSAVRGSRAVVAGVLAILSVLSLAAPASAATVTPVVEGLVGPLGLSVAPDGTLFIGEGFASQLTKVDRRGNREVVVANPGGEIAGVDAPSPGRIAYTAIDYVGEEGAFANGRLVLLGARGGEVDLAGYEEAENPDADQTYGFVGLSDECAAQVPPFVLPYPGIVESHPYAVAYDRGGWAVADAAGNDVLHVDARGNVSTIAVLPPTPQVVTAEVAAEFGLPECVTGLTYQGESVPTDVEVTAQGDYYVSTLPGAPELPGTGAVWHIDGRTSEVTMVASGFSGAVDLAVDRDGTVYVAELFAGLISALSPDGEVTTVAEVDSPGAVEVTRRGEIYATTGVFGETGSVVRITP